MKLIFIWGLSLYSTSLLAETINSKVYSIENRLVKFMNGRVAFIGKGDHEIEANDYLKATLDEKSNLISYDKIQSFQMMPMERPSLIQEDETFNPTIIPSMDEAIKIFHRSNPFYKRISECSDRAHVWAHDEFKFSGTKSMKAFVFFTASYINSVRFKWWFHVAPMYKVKDKGVLKDIVMDFRYTDSPMTVKEWTDHFIYTKRSCKVTTLFSEYDINPQTENCYLIFESMHYKIPAEINQKETLQTHKTNTSEKEINESFRYAFQY
jgi:hypothetical protein